MIAAIGSRAKPWASSTAETWLVSSQPSVATIPARASRLRASRPGNLRHMVRNQSGCFKASEPIEAQVEPLGDRLLVAYSASQFTNDADGRAYGLNAGPVFDSAAAGSVQ